VNLVTASIADPIKLNFFFISHLLKKFLQINFLAKKELHILTIFLVHANVYYKADRLMECVNIQCNYRYRFA